MWMPLHRPKPQPQMMLLLCADDPPFNTAKVPWEAKEWRSGSHICIQSAAFQLDQPQCYITSWSPSFPSLILPHMAALRASYLLQFYCASPSFLYHSLYLWFLSCSEAFPLLSTHFTHVSVVHDVQFWMLSHSWQQWRANYPNWSGMNLITSLLVPSRYR